MSIPNPQASTRDSDRVARTVSSALWASWADATGFISELTNESGLRRRTRGRPLSGPMDWTRRLGGKFGPNIVLPRGTYSDDTQLRLATSRAIGSSGFDAEAFARVELPIWDSYALGGGRASKAAAQAMRKAHAVWYAPDYPGWRDSGGNGAVMRIQPHAWAERDSDLPGPWIADLVANVVCTHSHPRAIIPSIMHALVLGRTLKTGQVPGPEGWYSLISAAAETFELLQYKPELGDYWLGRYEDLASAAGESSFIARWGDTVVELQELTKQILPLAAQLQRVHPHHTEPHKLGPLDSLYSEIADQLQLREPSRRGTGTNSIVVALALAWALQEDPVAAILVACRAVGTDTDTIATMVGALVGAANNAPLPGATEDFIASSDPNLPRTDDVGYQADEASRLALIALGAGNGVDFIYPDLLTWVPPKTQLDAVCLYQDRRLLAGLGFADPVSDALRDQRDQVWQWHLLDFGQHVLVKTRAELPTAQEYHIPRLSRSGLIKATRKQESSNSPRSEARMDTRSVEDSRRRNALAHLSGPSNAPHTKSEAVNRGESVETARLLDVDVDSAASVRGAVTDQEELRLFEVEKAYEVSSEEDLSSTFRNLRLPKNLDGRLAWITNHLQDDLAVAYFLRRSAEDLSLEEFLAVMALFRDRLKFAGKRRL